MANIIKNVITALIGAAALLAVILTLFGNRIYIVRSGSMEPAVGTGALAVVSTNTSYEEIKEGDIICFSAFTGTPVIHRAAAVRENGITTKGDANKTADASSVNADNYIGKLIFSVPYAGYAAGFLGSARGRIFCLTLLALAAVFYGFGKAPKKVTACFLAAVLILGVTGGSSVYAASGSEEYTGSPESSAEEQYAPDKETAVPVEEEETGENLNKEGLAENDPQNEDPADPGTDAPADEGGDPQNEQTIPPEQIENGGDEPSDVQSAEPDNVGEPGEGSDDEPSSEVPEQEDETVAETEEEFAEEQTEEPEEQTESAAENGTEELPEEEPVPEGENESLNKAPIRLTAAGIHTATVRYRINGGSIPSNPSAKTQYAVGTDIGINNTLIYRSTDYGATWSQLKTEVTTADTSADLENVGTIGAVLAGYRVTQAAAYNTSAEQTGVILCQNAGDTNPVTTKRLNGGTEITEDVTIDVYINWQTTLVLDANGGAVWGDLSVTSVNAGTVYYGRTYYLLNRLSEDYPSVDSSYIQTVPNFYREGYVFDGWNTNPNGSSFYGDVYSMNTQYGRGSRASIRQLPGESGSQIRLYARWIKREGVNGTVGLSNGASITNTDHFGRNSITGLDFTIPYTVSASEAADYTAASESPDFVWRESGGIGRFYYQRAVSNPSAAVSVPGTLRLRLGNRAFDNYGNHYDVQITLSNIVINPQRLGEYVSYDAGTISIFGYNKRTGLVTASVLSSKICGTSYDISIRILESGTDTEVTGLRTILYFQDLDSEDTSSRSSIYRYVRDTQGIAPYMEAITVPLSTAAAFYTKEGVNHIIAESLPGATRITGGEHTGPDSAAYGQITPDGSLSYDGIPMTGQEYTAVLYPVTSGAMELSWSGAYCSTSLFAAPPYGSIQILKASSDPDATDENDFYDLSGAVFGVYGSEENAQNAAQNGAVNGTEIAVLTTDGTGYSDVTQQLTLGTYYVAEITAPPGFRRSTQVQAVETGTQSEAVVFSDDPLLDAGELSILKVDESGEEIPEEYLPNLSGARFRLDYYRGIHRDLSSAEADVCVRSWTYETDGSGNLNFSDESMKRSGDVLFHDSLTGKPALPAGTVVITETKAPDGFELNPERYLLTTEPDPAGNFTRTFYDSQGDRLSEELVIREAAGIKIKEQVSRITLTVEKEIEKADLHKEHGEVSFAFEISGTDLAGKDHVFHRVISFAGEPDGEGTVQKEEVLLIPAGDYTVTELETDRYVLTQILALTDNLQAVQEEDGEPVGSIQAVIGYAKGTLLSDAEVLFRNRKTDWGGYSHTTSVVNHIGENIQV